LNLFSEHHSVTEDAWAEAENIPSKPHQFTVAGHGNAQHMFRSVGTAEHVPLTVKELADLIRAKPRFSRCKEVKLYACTVGQGSYAQELVKELDVDVRAPTGLIEFNINYLPGVKDLSGTVWKKFCPGGPPCR
jgi:hypothetical protein